MALALPSSLLAQSNKSHGTLISAAICKDGIIMYADSRAAWLAIDTTTKREVVFAYVDGMKKIFSIGDYKIGIADRSTLRNKYWEIIIEDFNRQVSSKTKNAVKTFNSFHNYVKGRFKVHDSTFGKTTFIMAGYDNSGPIILKINADGIRELKSVGNVVFSEPNAGALETMYKNQGGVYDSTNKGAIRMMDWIYNRVYSMTSHVGGPVLSLRINADNTTNTLRWFGPMYFRDYTTFEKMILKRVIPVGYFYEWSERTLFELLEKDIKNPTDYD